MKVRVVREQGAALITALLIVAITAALATALAVRERHLIDQAQWIVQFDRAMLALDTARAAEMRRIVAPRSGVLSLKVRDGRLIDQQALFNLNQLKNPDDQFRFARLLKALRLKLSKDQRNKLARAVSPWLKRHNFINVTQLREVPGITAEIYRRLSPFVTALALGKKKSWPVNVNHVRAPVLMTLSAALKWSQAQAIVSCVKQAGGFSKIAEFNRACVVPEQVAPFKNVATSSRHFILWLQVRAGIQTVQLKSLLVTKPRKNNKMGIRIVWQAYN